MSKIKSGNNQSQRTKAPNINETPRNQVKNVTLNGPSGGQTAPIKFTTRKPRG